MAIEPSKSDIQTIFKRLKSIGDNKLCFDCRANNPTWASVTYGVFLCIDCSAVHRSLGVHLTFIRSINLDTSWTWLQLRAMQLGGNANANAFFRQHGCDTGDTTQKYKSRAASMYREKLHALALKAMKLHGTKVHLDSTTVPSTPEAKEVDFFEEHEEFVSNGAQQLTQAQTLSSQPVPITNGNSAKNIEDDVTGAPNVDAALSMSPTEAIKVAEPRKSTIGARKPQSGRKGLGAKKGLGAQKVRTNFKEIESQAEQKDKERAMMEANRATEQAQRQAENERQLAAMKLAYQDLSVDEKKKDEKLKSMDPKKKDQMDRLGMGFGGSRGVSHSLVSDMTVIEQESPINQSRNTYEDRYSTSRNKDDDFEVIGGFHSGPPKYDDSPFSSSKNNKDDFGWGSSSSNTGKGDWSNDRFDSKSSSIIEDIPSRKTDDDKGRSRKNYEVSDSSDAQKKFGSAKAISSDAYFGKYDPDDDMHQKLSRFEGQSSISSADLYGNGQQQKDNYYNTGPDLQDIRDGVKQGVTKVAGRISNLANGIVNSLQDHYG